MKTTEQTPRHYRFYITYAAPTSANGITISSCTYDTTHIDALYTDITLDIMAQGGYSAVSILSIRRMSDTDAAAWDERVTPYLTPHKAK